MDRKDFEIEVDRILSNDNINSLDDLYDHVNKHQWFASNGRIRLPLTDYAKILEYTRHTDVENYCDMGVAFDSSSYEKTLVKMAMQSFYAHLADKSNFE